MARKVCATFRSLAQSGAVVFCSLGAGQINTGRFSAEFTPDGIISEVQLLLREARNDRYEYGPDDDKDFVI